MADATFTPGYKFTAGICLKECSHRGWRCAGCIRFSKYKPKKASRGREKSCR